MPAGERLVAMTGSNTIARGGVGWCMMYKRQESKKTKGEGTSPGGRRLKQNRVGRGPPGMTWGGDSSRKHVGDPEAGGSSALNTR